MRVFVGFDDTDARDSEYGTGKVVRWFQPMLPEGCRCQGVVRQQLLVCDDIPYTSHNSAACMVLEVAAPDLLASLVERAVRHIETHAADGSDPGLCVMAEDHVALTALMAFGRRCTHAVATQAEALRQVDGAHLSGHGGTNDGIIGAAAAVGLTASGWSGRYIELGDLRDAPEVMTVAEIQRQNIEVVAEDRDARLPAPEDRVLTHRWLRPRLIGHRPVLLVRPKGDGVWENIYCKRRKTEFNIKKQGR
jgi:tRNA(Ile2) C34 agmatinyltransferase TiaS